MKLPLIIAGACAVLSFIGFEPWWIDNYTHEELHRRNEWLVLAMCFFGIWLWMKIKQNTNSPDE